MTTLIESLLSPTRVAGTYDQAQMRRAANLLVRSHAQFVEAALADNPDGPVQMITEISRTSVDYVVVIGDPSDSMSPKGARAIWTKEVPFGATDRHCAGGAAFVEAAREQEAVAWAALELLEYRRGELCAQCAANEKTNLAGGHREFARQCRDYCLSGHDPNVGGVK